LVKYHDLPLGEARFSFISLLNAELRLMFRGQSIVWLILCTGLFLASIFAPIWFACQVALPLLWGLQILILSKLGSRESTNRCHEYIFSTAFPLRRQLPATHSSAVLVLLTLALPVIVRTFLAGNFYGVYAIVVGALFVPAFAITSGIFTGGSKLFEVIFTVIVYGILNRIPFFDIIGVVNGSREMGVAHYLFLFTVVLVILAFGGRKRQIAHSQ